MIHRIYCSLTSFKSLDLKPGLNVLIARKEAGASDKKTRNRAGKSSLIEIVHFLMGSEAGRDSLFRSEALVNESFGMEFDLGAERLRVERSGHQKSKIYVEGANLPTEASKFSNSEWLELLGERMFGLKQVQNLDGRLPTFRSLFSYFVRRQISGAFTTPEKHANMQQVCDYQVALLYLLGLDWRIASDWQIVRDREKTLNELRKAAKDGAFGSIVGKSSDLRTQLTVAETKLTAIKSQVAAFRVLPQYAELEVEADQLTRAINDLSNGNVIDIATISDLERAMQTEAPPPLTDVMTKYRLSMSRSYEIDETTSLKN
jgi:uncharacterized protein YydD (DUF2326 family)